MTSTICTACGTQYPVSPEPPERCVICSDARQFVPPTGQGWTTLDKLRVTHVNGWRRLRDDLYEMRTQPAFGIGQRALLLRTAHGNVLWDCITLLDAATVDIVNALGGINVIAISHPHYYTTMIEWAHEFSCEVWLHEADRDWVVRDDDAIHYWREETVALTPEITLLRLGGHFPGATVLHYESGDGTLLSGDVLQVTPDRSHVSFMYSYPNYLPVSDGCVKAIGMALEDLRYDSVYGSFDHAEIRGDAKQAVRTSVQRYLALLYGRFPETH